MPAVAPPRPPRPPPPCRPPPPPPPPPAVAASGADAWVGPGPPKVGGVIPLIRADPFLAGATCAGAGAASPGVAGAAPRRPPAACAARNASSSGLGPAVLRLTTLLAVSAFAPA